MKNKFYQLLFHTFETILIVIQACLNFLLEGLSKVFNFIYYSIASIFKGILWIIDKDRVYHAEQVLEQEDIGTELNILVRVSEIKNDALTRGAWTNNHSMLINKLSQQLYTDCDWSPHRIHTYMRAIVESIPGLSYVPGNEEEDDDDSINVSI